MQFDGGPFGLGVQFFAQRRVAFFILTQRVCSLPGRRVEVHQLTVGRFVRRVERQQRVETFSALPVKALRLIKSGDARQQRPARAAQLLAPRCGPVYIDVFRQQVAAVQRQRGLVSRDLTAPDGCLGGFLKGFDIDPQIDRRAQDYLLTLREDEPGVGG